MSDQWKKWLSILALSVIMLGWGLTVILSGLGWNVFNRPWNFSNTAQIGDSFGLLSMVMASVAAYFAYATFQSAKDDSKIVARRAAEPSFLNLLQARFIVMDNVIIGSNANVAPGARMNLVRGQVAINNVAGYLWHLLTDADSFEARKDIYGDVVSDYVGGLTNYHRFVFHIISFAQRQFSEVPDNQPMKKDDPAYSYVQLLRAQLSNEEMILMAANALYGAGNPKLKHFIERYALLNNMEETDIISLSLPSYFELSAFGLLDDDRPELVRNWSSN